MAGYSHEFGSGRRRDEPQTESEAVQLLRADLRCVTDTLHDLLNFGFPRNGRSADDKEAHENWNEETGLAVLRAYEALKLTDVFSLGVITQQPAHQQCRHPNCACERKVCGPGA